MQYPNHLILDLNRGNLPKQKSHVWGEEYLYKISNKNVEFSTKLNTVEYFSVNRKKSKFSESMSVNGWTYYTSGTNIFDINFLRKERLYTKLKYSRCPQYDIVSGGWAALFAGLIGFLISEKFGIELVDSGDFYTALMYGIFLVFSLRPILKFLGKDFSLKNLIIIGEMVEYFSLLFHLIISYFSKK